MAGAKAAPRAEAPSTRRSERSLICSACSSRRVMWEFAFGAEVVVQHRGARHRRAPRCPASSPHSRVRRTPRRAASRMRMRRSSAGIPPSCHIPNTNSVGYWHITERQFGWTECHGAHEATPALAGPARGDPGDGLLRARAHGEIQGRMIADPKVRADPGGFRRRAGGPGVLWSVAAWRWLTADHAVAHHLVAASDGLRRDGPSGPRLPGPLGLGSSARPR